jgi:hypothetical protein
MAVRDSDVRLPPEGEHFRMRDSIQIRHSEDSYAWQSN